MSSPTQRSLKHLRDVGYHGAMEFVAADTGYGRPVPIDPLDERAAMQRDYIAAVKGMALLAERMERCAEPAGLRKVA